MARGAAVTYNYVLASLEQLPESSRYEALRKFHSTRLGDYVMEFSAARYPQLQSQQVTHKPRQKVREPDCRESDCKEVREPDCKKVRESDCKKVREPDRAGDLWACVQFADGNPSRTVPQWLDVKSALL